MKKHFCITIDGPAGSGKSTIAQKLARNLGFMHLDSGAIYRCIALHCLNKNVNIQDSNALKESLEDFHYKVQYNKLKNKHFVNDQEVTDKIREQKVTERASELAAIQSVRELANHIQKDIHQKYSIVVDGRDGGAVVFPDADLKVFLTANLHERAKRRLKELPSKMSLAEVEKKMEERDQRDRTRTLDPLKRAKESYLIDSTQKTPQMIVNEIYAKVKALPSYKKQSKFWVRVIGKEKADASFAYKFMHTLLYGFFRLFYRIEVTGTEHVPKGASIITPNHESYLDPPAIGVMVPDEMHFVVNAYLFKIPILGRLIRKLNTHPIRGKNSELQVLKDVKDLLQKDYKIMMFPEGTRSRDGKIKRLDKRGVALLASLSNAPVVPAFIEGAFEIWPRKFPIPKLWGKLHIIFHPPIYWKDFAKKGSSAKEDQMLFMAHLEKILQDMEKQYTKK